MSNAWKLFHKSSGDMRQLIVMVGLPYSGKTTWALVESRAHGIPIVSPDALRMVLHGSRYQVEAEPLVWTLAKYMVSALFQAGHDRVIVDGCHTSKKRRDVWRSEHWYTFFHTMATPADLCRGRAVRARDQHMISVIDRMERQWEDVSNDVNETDNSAENFESETIHEYDATEAQRPQAQAVEKTETPKVEGQESEEGDPQGAVGEAQTQPVH